MKKDLGKIKQVELRDAWTLEPEFTRWLAEEENLNALSDELGLELSLIQTEANVGDFNVDILAEETGTGVKVIIENQLETTNHDHLGKLITYASGHDAKYVIWIFKDVREEHRQAIDWLNEHTTDDLNFFAVKLELWQIGDSMPAPKFDVICRPNEWAKTVKSSSDRGETSERNLQQLEFWTGLREYGTEHQKDIRFQSPRAQGYMDVSIGSSKAHVAMTVTSQKKNMTCQIYISDNKVLFDGLQERKDIIEKELGFAPDWQRLENAKASRIVITRDFDIGDLDKRNEYFDWLLKNASLFKKVFSKHVKEVEATL
jgi:hypothetical protein